MIAHSLNLRCKLNVVRSLRNKMFWSFVFGVMALTILKQILLNFNTWNHFKVEKFSQMTKTKHLCKVKRNWKRLFSAFFFVTFSKGGIIRQKANARAWNHADRSNSKIEWPTHLSNHGLNGISLLLLVLNIQESVTGSVRNLVKYSYINAVIDYRSYLLQAFAIYCDKLLYFLPRMLETQKS